MTTQRAMSPGGITGLDEPDSSLSLQLSRAPIAVRYLAAVVMTALATALAVGFDRAVTIPNLSLVYVIPVIIAAVTFGLGPSLCAAILGALAYNFFLTEPRYTLAVDDPANIWAIALLFVVGCIASAVASTARRRADEAANLRRQAALLQAYGRDVVAADQTRAITSLTAGTLEALFQVPVAVMLVSESTVDVVERRGRIQLIEAEMEAAQSALTAGRRLPAGVYPFDTSRFDFWPVATAAGPQAVIGLAFDPADRPSGPGTLVETIGSLLALALERRHVEADGHH